MFSLCFIEFYRFIYLKCSKMNWIMIVLFHPEGKVWVNFSTHTQKKKPFSPYFSAVMCTAHLSPPTQKTYPSHKLFYLYTVLQLLYEQAYQPIVTESGSKYSICDSTSLTRHITANPKSCYLRLATHFKHNVGVTCSS